MRVVVAGNCSAHAPAAMPWTKPRDHLGRVGMPEENIVGIVCGTSEVWGGSKLNVMAVIKMLTAAFS